VSFESEREAEAYAIADNHLTEVGGWDYMRLASIVQDLAAEGDGSLEGLGYEDYELKKMLGLLEEQGRAEGVDPEERKSNVIECPACGHKFAKVK